MKKAEYIEKYGEEAWQRYLEKCRKYNKAYFIEKRGKDAWEKEKERKKEWWKINSGKNKEYYWQSPEHHRESCRKRKEKAKESIKEWAKEYAKTKMCRANSIKTRYNDCDKFRGFDISNNITSKWIVENIFSGQKCVYCGDQDWTHLGCDRIDNTKPHTPDNVVCSCGLCNIERGDNYTVEDFKQYRSLHPRACDIPKAPAIQLSETGALKKRAVRLG